MHSRRTFSSKIATCLASGVIGVNLPASQGALAQAIEAATALRTAEEQARGLLNEAASSKEWSDEFSKRTLEQLYFIRLNLAKQLPLGQLSVSLPIHPDAPLAAVIVLEHQKTLTPSPETIQIDESSILDTAPECDRLGGVLSLVLDVLLLPDDRTELIRALLEDTSIQELCESIAGKAQREEWTEVPSAVINLILKLTAPELFVRLLMFRVALRTVSLRWLAYFVPLSGWLYISIVIFASIRKNHSKIFC